MSKYRKKIKPQLNTNYKLFGWIGAWLDEIENRIDNIDGDGIVDTIENSVKNIWSKIYNLENKHDNEMKIESEVRKTNDDFLQSQINTLKDTTIPTINTRIDNLETKHDNEMKVESEVRKTNDDFLQSQINTIKDTTIPAIQNQIDEINNTTIPAINETITNNYNLTDEKLNKEIQDRIAGDNAINKRIDDIQFLKWLTRLEFGADLSQKMLLQDEDWVMYFPLPENYGYTRSYILALQLIIDTNTLYHGEIQLLNYGLKTNLVSHDSQDCLEVTYTASENKHGALDSTHNVVLEVLLTQWYYFV